jgi:glucose-6-phosphate-specific signal transduction histidine kinase
VLLPLTAAEVRALGWLELQIVAVALVAKVPNRDADAITDAVPPSQISVTIRSGETLEASIADDGVGDADPGSGSGLTGLVDRVDALGGRFELDSPPQGGTRSSIELPLEPATVL